MNDNNPTVQPGLTELLAEWEGPAIHEPGVLFDEKQVDHLSAGGSVAEPVAWLATAAVSGMVGNSAYDAIKMKARRVLGDWRQRHGKAKLEEVKQELWFTCNSIEPTARSAARNCASGSICW